MRLIYISYDYIYIACSLCCVDIYISKIFREKFILSEIMMKRKKTSLDRKGNHISDFITIFHYVLLCKTINTSKVYPSKNFLCSKYFQKMNGGIINIVEKILILCMMIFLRLNKHFIRL